MSRTGVCCERLHGKWMVLMQCDATNVRLERVFVELSVSWGMASFICCDVMKDLNGEARRSTRTTGNKRCSALFCKVGRSAYKSTLSSSAEDHTVTGMYGSLQKPKRFACFQNALVCLAGFGAAARRAKTSKLIRLLIPSTRISHPRIQRLSRR